MSTRRLIGPTILTTVLCGLWIDYLFFSESPWSITSFLAKVLAIAAGIFGPALNPGLYSWVEDITIPLLMAVLGIALLLILISRAKADMNKATPRADTPLLEAMRDLDLVPNTSAKAERAAIVLASEQHQSRLLTKFIISFTGISILFSIAAYLISYQFIRSVTEKNIQKRADSMALGIADISARRLAAGNPQELAATMARYAPIHAVAYVYVEDAGGRIVAYTPTELLRYLNRDFPGSAEQAIHGVEVQYRGMAVYEIAKRIAGKGGGFVHLGIWRATNDEETRRVMMPILLAMFSVLIGIIGAFVLVVRSINRPFLELVDQAERISKGDLALPVESRRADEIGQIAQSLERLRSSLHAAVIRLGQS